MQLRKNSLLLDRAQELTNLDDINKWIGTLAGNRKVVNNGSMRLVEDFFSEAESARMGTFQPVYGKQGLELDSIYQRLIAGYSFKIGFLVRDTVSKKRCNSAISRGHLFYRSIHRENV